VIIFSLFIFSMRKKRIWNIGLKSFEDVPFGLTHPDNYRDQQAGTKRSRIKAPIGVGISKAETHSACPCGIPAWRGHSVAFHWGWYSFSSLNEWSVTSFRHIFLCSFFQWGKNEPTPKASLREKLTGWVFFGLMFLWVSAKNLNLFRNPRNFKQQILFFPQPAYTYPESS